MHQPSVACHNIGACWSRRRVVQLMMLLMCYDALGSCVHNLATMVHACFAVSAVAQPAPRCGCVCISLGAGKGAATRAFACGFAFLPPAPPTKAQAHAMRLWLCCGSGATVGKIAAAGVWRWRQHKDSLLVFSFKIAKHLQTLHFAQRSCKDRCGFTRKDRCYFSFQTIACRVSARSDFTSDTSTFRALWRVLL